MMTYLTKRYKSGLAFLLLMLCATWGRTDSLFDQSVGAVNENSQLMTIAERLGKPDVMRSQFQQQKTLKILRRPMVSNGNLIYAKDQGLYWHVDLPFPSTLIITESALLQKDGKNVQKVTASSQPAIFGFSQVFFKLLSGDIAALTEHFTLYFEPSTDTQQQWRIGLLPKDQQLKQFVGQVVLQGNELLESVHIVDKSGDKTAITFSSTDIAAKPLSAVERGYFEF